MYALNPTLNEWRAFDKECPVPAIELALQMACPRNKAIKEG